MSLAPLDPPVATSRPPSARTLALDAAFWRRLAHLGSSRAPSWFVRWSPPIIGAAIALLRPDVRSTLSRQLARARGPARPLRDTLDVVRTVANFASCFAEVLSAGSKNALEPRVAFHRSPCIDALFDEPGGLVFATAHTAGWELLGSQLARRHAKPVMLVMQRERDDRARQLQDELRRSRADLRIVHVGGDPLEPLALVRHLRDGGVVALQIDRVPRGMAARPVELFGGCGAIPEGPLRLAQLTGAPIVAAFSARTGHGRYDVYVRDPVRIERGSGDAGLDAAAQQLAGAFGDFVAAHPTQWFAFHE